MKSLLLVAVAAVVFYGVGEPAGIEVQTSWYLGAGELGPVPHWGERFYDSDSVVHTLEGQLTLLAREIDHNSWVKHTIESNSNIESHGNPLPADMDDDGDLDLVAVIGGSENSVVWYEKIAGGYVKHTIGHFVNGSRATTWPWDLDGDGDFDVVASADEGLAWFENNSLSFTEHAIDGSRPYLYARPGDMDNDGDVDIVVHDKSSGTLFGDLFLFRNDGVMNFTRELIYNATTTEIWRVNLADFDGDSYLDIQTSMYPLYVFLNDRTGSFTKVYQYGSPPPTDGSWPSDFDGDGDVDIMGAVWGGGSYPTPLYWLENDGTGTGYAYHEIGGPSGDYGDGGMARDVNLDGLMDALGTYRYVGWFEQLPGGGFVEHRLPDSYFYDSHWVYGENLDGAPCLGDVDIDILAAKNGEYAWWENRIVTFAGQAWLESSILDAQETVFWDRFGWEDHVPAGNQLRYRVRCGNTVAEVLSALWSSPITASGDSLSEYGISQSQYFQYRIEFERATGMADRSPTVYEVWVESSPTSPPCLVTGGGWIAGDQTGRGNKRTFGFNAHSEGSLTWGQLQFVDHETKMNVHSDTIEALSVFDDTTAHFSGRCRINGASGYTFRCEVDDRGEPGRGADRFSIDIHDPFGKPHYAASDVLGGGNIQVHVFVNESLVERQFRHGVNPPGDVVDDSPRHDQPLPSDRSATDQEMDRDLIPGSRERHHSEVSARSRSVSLSGSWVAADLNNMKRTLYQNSPNPFSSSTVIRYQIPSSCRINLSIFDVSGQLIMCLVDGIQAAGNHSVEWDGTDDSSSKVSTGIYICRLCAGDTYHVRKMAVVH